LRLEGVAEVVTGFGIIRPDRQRPATDGFRVREPSLFLEGDAQVVTGFGIIRPDRKRPEIACFGVREPSLLLEGVAEVAVRFGKIRFDRERPAVTGFGLRETALLLEGVAQVAVCLRVFRRQFHRFPHWLQRFHPSSLLIQRHPKAFQPTPFWGKRSVSRRARGSPSA